MNEKITDFKLTIFGLRHNLQQLYSWGPVTCRPFGPHMSIRRKAIWGPTDVVGDTRGSALGLPLLGLYCSNLRAPWEPRTLQCFLYIATERQAVASVVRAIARAIAQPPQHAFGKMAYQERKVWHFQIIIDILAYN